MDIRKIYFPRSSSLASVMKVANYLRVAPVSRHYVIDFENLLFVSPFTLLFLSQELQRFRNRHAESEIIIENAEQNTYASHMGFFQACGFDIGKRPGEAEGGHTYLPITIIKLPDLIEEARASRQRIGDIIEGYSARFAKMLIQQEDGSLVDLLTFSIREILRNIVEHSKAQVLELCAKWWPNDQLVEVAILDSGIGIRDSLKLNPYLEINSDRDAINMALLPGVSGKVWKGIKSDPDDPWSHSGYGLYMTSGLCRDGGTFFLCSGNSGILLRGDNKYDFNTVFEGTAIRLRIDHSKIIDFRTTLTEISKTGSKIQRKFKGTKRIAASTASRMLARDFKDY